MIAPKRWTPVREWIGRARAAWLCLTALAAPPQCPSCGRRIAAAPAFCRDCRPSVARAIRRERRVRRRVRLPGGRTFRVLSVGALSGAWGRAVRAYKKDPERAFGRMLAAPLARACGRACRRGTAPEAPPEILVPVPMAPVRRRERGRNPAERLAGLLAEATGLRAERDLLVRRRYRRPLRGLSARARRLEVEGAFALASPLAGGPLRVWLVDDVHTTGATLAAAAAPLEAAGHRVRGALVLARTPKRVRRGLPQSEGARAAPLEERNDVPRDRDQRRSE